MKIKKGDQVKMIAGKDRGKTGTVSRVFPEAGRIAVEGINLYKKHVRPKRQGQKGETVVVARPFSASNAMVVCPSCKNPSRMGSRIDGGRKSRFCKKCGAIV